MKVDILPFLTAFSSLGLPIVCKFEEWKRFGQLLVGKPTLAKLHMINTPLVFVQKEISEHHLVA